jgi:type IV pilus assembly protein PilF
MRYVARLWLVCAITAVLAACTTTTSTPVKRESADKRAALHAQLGARYIQRGQYNVAMQELNTALKVDSNSPLANYVMAVLQRRLRDPQAAERYFKRAISLKPDYAAARRAYAVFLCERGRQSDGLSQLDSALTNPLYNAPELIYQDMGECLLSQPVPDYRGAEGHLRKALEINPRLPMALLYMAQVSYEQGSLLSARGYVQRYFAVAPDSPRSLYWGTRIEQRLGARDVAADYLRRLKLKYPDSEEAKRFDNRSTR